MPYIWKNNNNRKTNILFYFKRTNYKDKRREVISGVSNDDGNVVGTLIHGCLDYNPELVDNIFSFLDLNEKEIIKIKEENKKLKK